MGSPLDQLSPKTQWLGQHRTYFEETDSTNLRAEELADAGAPDGALAFADRQTAGRGRLGRSFFSPGGVGLYLSFVLRPVEMEAEHAHLHVFAAAVAVARVVEELLEARSEIEIKWPNDVLLRGRKTSGINLSVRLGPDSRLAWMILGIGVNVNTDRHQFPDELRDLATSVALECGGPLDRTAFAARLLTHLESELDALRRGEVQAVLERWKHFFRLVGEQVRVGIGAPDAGAKAFSSGASQGAIEGIVRGVDHDGALLVETDGQVRRVVAGDVTLLRRKV